MNSFNARSNTVWLRLVDLAGWFYGCAHSRMTFPITLRASASADEQPGTTSETYIVCLECGRHFAYDWTRMRLTNHRFDSARRRPDLDGTLRSLRESKAGRGLL